VTPVVRSLLIANLGAFLLQLSLPWVTNVFAFVPRLAVIRPWTIITYMFLHGGLWHLVFNMLGLFFFGPRVESRLGSQRFAILYFLSGITGAIVSFFFSPFAPIIGASAGVFGVMMGFAFYWPNEPILIWGIIPVPARLLVIGTTILALWSGLGGVRSGIAHFAHLGGYAGAYLYLKWLERSRTSFKRKAAASTPAADRRVAGWNKIDMTTVHEVNRDEVNRILDKISAQGVGSLTPQERTFLSNFVPPDDRAPTVQ
jgi:membrane associated rhomboid family serine protease